MEKYSVIVPVYNRIDEVDDLLASLAGQTARNFEVIIVEDGSTQPCRKVTGRYAGKIDIRYFFKENEGRQRCR